MATPTTVRHFQDPFGVSDSTPFLSIEKVGISNDLNDLDQKTKFVPCR